MSSLSYFNSLPELSVLYAVPVNTADSSSVSPKYANQLSFDEVKEAALERLEEVLDTLDLFEEGKQVGNEFKMLNPKRNDCGLGSFSINTETGIWSDFAEDNVGGDIVSLVAYILDKDQVEAKNWLVNELGLDKASLPAVKKATKIEPEQTCILPIPEAMANEVLQRETNPYYNHSLWDGVAVKSFKAYAYRNATGQINAFMLRYNLVNGKKEVRPYSCWQQVGQQPKMKFSGPAKSYTLYNLDQLTARSKAPVLVTEGEKSADAASILFPDHVVVTTMFGAKSPLNSDLTPLIGRQVTFWPDNDDAGTGYAKKIADFLHKQDATMKMQALIPPKFMPGKDANGLAILEPRAEELFAGWDAADALAEGWTVEHIKLLPAEQYVPYQTTSAVVSQPDILETHAYNYSISGGDLCIGKLDKETGELFQTPVSSAMVVIALTRDEHNQNWGRLVYFRDSDGKKHEIAIPCELLSAKSSVSFVQDLLSHGLIVYIEKLLKEYIMKANPPARVKCVKQTGWHDNVFVLPEKTFGEGTERVLLQTTDLSHKSAYGTNNSLDDWQHEVGSLCIGNSRLIFSISTALAGPFLEPMNIENGGFHFRGKSSTGKSTALKVAASVWGGKQMIKLWRTTDNAIESTAFSHNDTVLCLDEIGQVDPSKAGDIAYTLANGSSKMRATRSGGARDNTNWRLLFISNGEISLASHMESAGKQVRAGQEMRMLDIPADAQKGMGMFEDIHDVSSPDKFADLVALNSCLYYGSAGEALLELLTDPDELPLAVEFVRAKKAEFMSAYIPAGAHGQIQRAGNRFALVAGAGEYCINRGILPFAAGDVISATGACFKAWMGERGGDQALEDVRALVQVRAFLERHGESRFSSTSEYSSTMCYESRTNQRAGHKHVLRDGIVDYWVFPEAYHSDVCDGLDHKLVTRILKQHGYLELDNKGSSTITKKIPGIGNKRVYVIKAAILQDEEEEELRLAA